jgi:hypothetical protein
MRDHDIGLDCAGFVQQAYLAGMGVSRAQARFTPNVVNEDLSRLEHRGYQQIAPADARPGDLMVLGAPPRTPNNPHPVGHRVLVYESHPANARELDQMRRQILRVGGDVPLPAGRVTVITGLSSWGSGGHAMAGGVQRATFYHDEATDVWVTVKGQQAPWAAVGQPYGHPFDGIFRSR